jgi:hypothetical protein
MASHILNILGSLHTQPGCHFFKYEAPFRQFSGARRPEAGRNRPIPQEYYIGGFLRCRAARGYRLNAKSSAGRVRFIIKKKWHPGWVCRARRISTNLEKNQFF